LNGNWRDDLKAEHKKKNKKKKNKNKNQGENSQNPTDQ